MREGEWKREVEGRRIGRKVRRVCHRRWGMGGRKETDWQGNGYGGRQKDRLGATGPGLIAEGQMCCHRARFAVTGQGLLSQGQVCCHSARFAATAACFLSLG